MKQIQSSSYVQAQQQTVTFDPKRLKNQQGQQNDPRIRTFQQAFNTLSLQSITNLTEADAMALNDIQTKIRQKLRMVGFTRMGF